MKQTLENAGTPDARGTVECKACHHVADIRTFLPVETVYQDIRCPQCGSTHNDHNAAYQERLFASMRASSPLTPPAAPANH